MRRTRHWGLALWMCGLLVLGLMGRAEGSDVYFMSVNDTLLEFRAATMPVQSGGILYIPYSMLNPKQSGIDLGVGAMYSRAQNQAVVYSKNRLLVFDIDANRTYDSEDQEYPERVMVRNGMVYLPIERICTLFPELRYSVIPTEYGTMVRVKNSSVVLSDDAFVSATLDNMRGERMRYEQELAAQMTTPSPTPTPAPPPPPVQPSSPMGGTVYLAFDMDGNDMVDSLLTELEQREGRGLFFFELSELTGRDELIRRLVGRGHWIGLKITTDKLEEGLAQLEEGQAVLRTVARCRVTAVLAEQLDQEQIHKAGWVCWSSTVDGRDLSEGMKTPGNEVIRRLSRRNGTEHFLLLSEQLGGSLSSVLTSLRRSGYLLEHPVSTALI